MATGRQWVPGAHTCAICLGSFTDPRFLPNCCHTFCGKCIKDISDKHSGGSFPCPSCRKPSTLPQGGVKDLQINFYINTQKPPRPQPPPRGGLMCQVHKDEKLRFYCVPCKQVICRDCKLTKHEGHATEDLHTAETRIKNKMAVVEKIVTNKIRKYNDHLNRIQHRKVSSTEKKTYLEKSILDRHATMVAAADKARDEALESLKTAVASVDDQYKKEMDDFSTSATFQSACYDNCKLTNISGKSIVDIVSLANEMGLDLELEDSQLLRELDKKFPKTKGVETVRAATHRTNKMDDINTIVQSARDFVGEVVTTELTDSDPEVTVVERFTVGDETNIRVFCLCFDDEVLMVSFDHQGLDVTVPVMDFSEAGHSKRNENKKGKVSYKRNAEKNYMYPIPMDGIFATYTKSLLMRHFRIYNRLDGHADVDMVKVTSTEHCTATFETIFKISVGNHRAADVDDTEQLFVVLEE